MAKVVISIPDEDLARVDPEAARRGASRSALLREAALSELEVLDPTYTADEATIEAGGMLPSRYVETLGTP